MDRYLQQADPDQFIDQREALYEVMRTIYFRDDPGANVRKLIEMAQGQEWSSFRKEIFVLKMTEDPRTGVAQMSLGKAKLQSRKIERARQHRLRKLQNSEACASSLVREELKATTSSKSALEARYEADAAEAGDLRGALHYEDRSAADAARERVAGSSTDEARHDEELSMLYEPGTWYCNLCGSANTPKNTNCQCYNSKTKKKCMGTRLANFGGYAKEPLIRAYRDDKCYTRRARVRRKVRFLEAALEVNPGDEEMEAELDDRREALARGKKNHRDNRKERYEKALDEDPDAWMCKHENDLGEKCGKRNFGDAKKCYKCAAPRPRRSARKSTSGEEDEAASSSTKKRRTEDAAGSSSRPSSSSGRTVYVENYDDREEMTAPLAERRRDEPAYVDTRRPPRDREEKSQSWWSDPWQWWKPASEVIPKWRKGDRQSSSWFQRKKEKSEWYDYVEDDDDYERRSRIWQETEEAWDHGQIDKERGWHWSRWDQDYRRGFTFEDWRKYYGKKNGFDKEGISPWKRIEMAKWANEGYFGTWRPNTSGEDNQSGRTPRSGSSNRSPYAHLALTAVMPALGRGSFGAVLAVLAGTMFYKPLKTVEEKSTELVTTVGDALVSTVEVTNGAFVNLAVTAEESAINVLSTISMLICATIVLGWIIWTHQALKRLNRRFNNWAPRTAVPGNVQMNAAIGNVDNRPPVLREFRLVTRSWLRTVVCDYDDIVQRNDEYTVDFTGETEGFYNYIITHPKRCNRRVMISRRFAEWDAVFVNDWHRNEFLCKCPGFAQLTKAGATERKVCVHAGLVLYRQIVAREAAEAAAERAVG